MAHTARLTTPWTRAETFKHAYWRYFIWFLVSAAVAHALVIYYAAAPPTSRGFDTVGEELAVVDIPPETKIPPPPPELARPATPVIGTAVIEEDVTIAVTEIIEDAPIAPVSSPPPVLALEPEVDEVSFAFTPYTVKPSCKTGCAPKDLMRFYPSILRDTGIACNVTIGIRIDTAGNVTATDVLKSSGHTMCDASVRRWAETTTWTVAYNRDQPVVVWVAQPIEIAIK